jgi:opacity protein-like surface antigen
MHVGGVTGAALPAVSSAGDFYIGADAVMLATDLDYGYTESYSTEHARVKAGYEFSSNFALEAQVLSAASDTDLDYVGNTFELDTGNIVGVFAKFKSSNPKVNFYGLAGLEFWDTTYTWIGPGFKDSETLTMLGLAVGGEFNITKNLMIDVEGSVHVGSADYSSFFTDSVDVTSLGLAVGLNYRF